jgi:mannitol/fructose-specific phosphotransferase system IIA component (Ntr-type)
MQRLLREKKTKRLVEYLAGKSYVRGLAAPDRWKAIARLSELVAQVHGLSAAAISAAVVEREQIMGTGLGQGVAVPHARLTGITAPIVAVGMSEEGVDFDAPDGKPARLIILILTPAEDAGAHLSLLADVSRAFSDHRMVERALACKGFTEFLALLKSNAGEG